MKWVDRQGSNNIEDLRRLASSPLGVDDTIGMLIQQAEADMATMSTVAGDGSIPLPRRRPVGTTKDWAGRSRRSAERFGGIVVESTVPLPRPRPPHAPSNKMRRYNSGEE